MKTDIHTQLVSLAVRCLMLSGVAFLLSATAAMSQSVDAELLAAEVQVGEPVQFVITATGKSQGKLLEPLEVDGLEVVGTSDQYQMQMSFPGGMQVTTRMVLTLSATREGKFSIPSLRVRLDGKVFKTKPSELSVVPNMGGVRVLPAIPVPRNPQSAPQMPAPGSPAPSEPAPSSRGTFGEMVIPKRSAYVGEIVPVDLRFYVDSRLPAQVSERPSFGGEGFTVQRTARPTEATREMDGISYGCFVYRTAITAAKAGPLEVPAATLAARVQVPVSAPPGVDDFFGGMLRNFGMTDIREVEIATDSVGIEVKPLPAQGRTPDFAGAVGEFSIEATASPPKAAAGEPIVLRVVVSGRGNFEAMGAPVLTDAEGWRVYDPSEKFEPSASDPIGFSGEKIYEFTLVARQEQRATPPVQFTFFDPSQEKYITLTAPPVAVEAAGSAPAVPSGAVASNSPGTPAPPEPVAEGNDLSRDFTPANFVPLGWSPMLIAAGGALAGAWALGFLALLYKRYSDSPAAARAAELKRLRSGLKSLRNASLSDTDFLDGASRFIEARLEGTSLEDAIPAPELRDAVHEVLNRQAEVKFSTRSASGLSTDARADILKTLHSFDESLPRRIP